MITRKARIPHRPFHEISDTVFDQQTALEVTMTTTEPITAEQMVKDIDAALRAINPGLRSQGAVSSVGTATLFVAFLLRKYRVPRGFEHTVQQALQALPGVTSVGRDPVDHLGEYFRFTVTRRQP